MGPAKISAHRNMRMRYLLAHPEHMKGQREIMRALTARRGYGVEFVEQAQLSRMALFTCGLFAVALAIVIGYGACTGDWLGGFTIGGEPHSCNRTYHIAHLRLFLLARCARSVLRAMLRAADRVLAGGCVVTDARVVRRTGGSATGSLGPPRLVRN